MKRNAFRFLLWLTVLIALADVDAQDEPTTRAELWPEVDVYIHPTPKFRLYFLGRVSQYIEGANDLKKSRLKDTSGRMWTSFRTRM
jgi:hypothetical protein